MDKSKTLCGSTEDLFDLYMDFSHEVVQNKVAEIDMTLEILDGFNPIRLKEFIDLVEEDVNELGVKLSLKVKDDAGLLE